MNRRTNTRAPRSILGLATGCVLTVAAMLGCTSHAGSSYPDPGSVHRQPDLAREFHAKATEAMDEGKVATAEKYLRRALAADLYHGPAHNNLGLLLLEQGDLYAAANEFEWARKLMPGHPDPRVNLAMTLERAGQTDEALQAYDAALAVWDHYLPAMQGKARLQIMRNRIDESTSVILEQIAIQGDAEWREWARAQLIKLQ